MALFKILRGSSDNFEANLTSSDISPKFVDGYCYFLTGTNMFYVDYVDNLGVTHRVPLNSENANTITVEEKNAEGNLVYVQGGKVVDHILNFSSAEIPTSRLVYEESQGLKTSLSLKMDKQNPTGTGSLSINRKANTTVGSQSVAVGSAATASGNYSFAEGQSSTASGQSAHAEGRSTTASGAYSHAEGYSSTASGQYSHAANLGTRATAAAQTAIGKYNAEDADALFIIGNGTASNDRSNALTVSASGAVKSSVEVADLDDEKHLITKEYFKRNFVKPIHRHQKCEEGSSEFSFPDFNFNQPNLHLIYFNGLLLIEGVHYEIKNSSTLTLLGWTATKDDYIQVVCFKPVHCDESLLN